MPESETSGVDRRSHWQRVHESKPVDGVSWWQSVPELSLGLVRRAGLPADAPVIDVGAGSSTLVDHLAADGFRDLTAIDLSTAALDNVGERLGDLRRHVLLQVADVLTMTCERRFRLWHDRAVFHFLTEADERAAYLAALRRCLEQGGFVVVATFGPEGPASCSGLRTARYSHTQLAAEFPDFQVIAEEGEDHQTPWGTRQQFIALLLRHAP